MTAALRFGQQRTATTITTRVVTLHSCWPVLLAACTYAHSKEEEMYFMYCMLAHTTACTTAGGLCTCSASQSTLHSQAEQQLSELVVAKAVSAKIDRPAGVVVIGKAQTPEDTLNAWSRNISKLLGLVEKATQQIQKEAMVHKVSLGTAA